MTSLPVGIVTPVLTAVPGQHDAWERSAAVDDLVRVARAADRLGFDHLTCSEHVAVPSDVAEQRGGTYWDPVASLSYLACATRRIRLVPLVVVLGYAHPLAIAKRYGTLDRLSGGRLTLGVGVGSLEQEFDLLGVPFQDRGARADDALLAVRGALSSSRPVHAGPHFRFGDVVVEPSAVQPRVPVWVGGRSARSLRRAVELGDGWVPFGLGGRALGDLLGEVELPPGFDVVLSTGRLDPGADPDGTLDRLARLQEVGATRVTASVVGTSVDHYVEQLQALAALRVPAPPGQVPPSIASARS